LALLLRSTPLTSPAAPDRLFSQRCFQ
jgi:hypothetical protein